MDTSETYIKMCDCEEIRSLETGKYEGSFFAYRVRNKWYVEVPDSYYGLPHDAIQKSIIWLPRQDQLQEMSGLCWPAFDKSCLEDAFIQSTTKEIAGIQVVMEEKFGKEWTGTEWMKSN